MANIKRKTKKEIMIQEKMRIRIISVVILFITVLGVFKLGVIGDLVNQAFLYLAGNVAYILYAVLIFISLYLLYFGKVFKISGPKAVGTYLVLLAAFILFSVPAQNIVGFEHFSLYVSKNPFTGGGVIGSILYSIFSILFSRVGTLIFAGLVLVIGLLFLGVKTYLEHVKVQESIKKVIHPSQDKPLKTKLTNKFQDFFPDDKEADLVDDVKADKPLPVEPKTEKKLTIHEPKKEAVENKKEELDFNLTSTNSHYKLPPLSLLNGKKARNTGQNKTHAVESAERLTDVLREFGVNAAISDIFIGPSVTKYELKLETGTRVNKIMQLQDDIKLALATKDIRIEAPIPGKAAVGVEIPNAVTSTVTFRELFNDIPPNLKENKLLVPLGKDVSGKEVFAELNKMPHLLIAGATGSGKSVCINTIISSILMRARPDEVKLILVDPKKVELSVYNNVPHLLAPVVSDSKKAAATLKEVVWEMENRYEQFAKYNVRNINGYNDYVNSYNLDNPDDQLNKMPFIVVIIDEVADLMMVASKDVEDCIMRLAQMARAAGIHMIVATQRPSTDVITGVIKANIPSRIAFAVSSSIDSRTILDASGAEKLIGKGDMLFSPMGSNAPIRVQGAFVSDQEVADITKHCRDQQTVQYEEKFENAQFSKSSTNGFDEDENDEEYEECRAFVIEAQKASTSLLQRRFRIGYNKAARIIDQLEAEGVIGPQLGSKPREVLIKAYSEEDNF